MFVKKGCVSFVFKFVHMLCLLASASISHIMLKVKGQLVPFRRKAILVSFMPHVKFSEKELWVGCDSFKDNKCSFLSFITILA